MSEQFVKIPGIIELRWTSDDPEYSNPTTDLYDEQARGIPQWWENKDNSFTQKSFCSYIKRDVMICRYGQKNPRTTEQAIFACLICDCDIKSVKTLRLHIAGSQHQRGELQKKKVRNDVSTNLPATFYFPGVQESPSSQGWNVFWWRNK